MRLNAAKSNYCIFGAKQGSSQMVVNGSDIGQVRAITYLGVELYAGTKLSCGVDAKLNSFYRATNALLCHANDAGLKNSPSVLFCLFKVYCVPILRYGIGVVVAGASRRDRARLRIAYNSAVRRIFKIHKFDPVPCDLCSICHVDAALRECK